MEVSIISHSSLGENVCGIAAKTCVSHKIPSVQDDVSKPLKSAVSSGHESILEHWNATFSIAGISRALLAQLSRHRLISLSVQSQRYVGMGDFDFTVPKTISDCNKLLEKYNEYMYVTQEFYSELVSNGIPKEDARYILPNAVTTNVVLTANARELNHIFSLRCCSRAQSEFRELANKMLRLCKEIAPALFANSGASCKHGACPEGDKSCKKNVTVDTHRESNKVQAEKDGTYIIDNPREIWDALKNLVYNHEDFSIPLISKVFSISGTFKPTDDGDNAYDLKIYNSYGEAVQRMYVHRFYVCMYEWERDSDGLKTVTINIYGGRDISDKENHTIRTSTDSFNPSECSAKYSVKTISCNTLCTDGRY